MKKKIKVPTPTNSGACAIVVLFHPDAAFGWRLHKILTQFSSVILVDNTPKGAALTNLPSSVRVLQNGRNLGIATALNKGIDLAIEKGYEWVATFDQDSEILPGYLENMVSISARQTPTPVLVGCNYLHDGDTKVVHRAPHKATEAWARQTLITSGTFMPACFAREIGGFREDYFIDSVDHEFCLRAHRHGAEILMTVQPFMRHRMGNAGACLFGLTLSLQHQATRRYYLARNTILTIRQYGTAYPCWATRQIFRLIGEGLAIAFIESDKTSKICAFTRGLWHGLIGRSGPLEKI
ncbi:glycosyltransferase [Pseudomonas anguilliseptica]|uniref:Rhamnosyltransferase n=2 Tax=Pseudomonas anguilliseptica TaxID=53406 RepID=A0A1H5APY4_PSEAG|nr:glycosyltransferase [Pseudomonas anguilliseptica]SED44302.1 rhamnosyltransferase [Pseudomonas anguilliseptica]